MIEQEMIYTLYPS